MSEGWNIAILGATGAVGEALLETLAERQFPVGEIYALARHESAGEHLEVIPYVLADYRNRNVIAVADSLTSQLLAALKPLIDQGGLSRIAVTSMLSASAQGKKAVDALAGQSAKLLNGIPIDEDDFFGRQLAFAGVLWPCADGEL